MSIDSSFESEESFASDSEKSPETLEREINAQRSAIGNIVDALESKFSPGQLLDQALSYTKGNSGEFFGNLATTVKSNPLPTVLTSVGLLWLMMNQNRSPSTTSGPSSLGHLGDRVSDMAHSVTDSFSDAKSRIEETARRMKDKAGQVTDKAGELTDKVSEKLSATGQQFNQGSHDATDTLHQQARNAQSGFNYMLQEQPLALAAIGIALGAALGAALPVTERENRMMGEASDELTGKAKSLATEGYEKVSQMGKELIDDAKSSTPPSNSNPQKTAFNQESTPGLG
jgi:ElaB/YqjD/DUF883 family membrane-anchored ribosome-binding protein